MGTKQIIGVCAFSLLFFSATAFSGSDQFKFTTASGYAAGHDCRPKGSKKKNQEGGDESKGGETPSKHTWENPDGWVMGAVAPELWDKMKHCTATVGGKKIKVEDTCPECSSNGKIDINHSSCDQMGSNPDMSGAIDWDCSTADAKGRNAAKNTKN